MDHELTSWIITYDKLGLCSNVQGLIQSGDSKELSGKQLIAITDIGCLDLRSKTIKTNSGKGFKLIGPGAQSILTPHLEPFGFIQIREDDVEEDDY